jgi:hypothetical protein
MILDGSKIIVTDTNSEEGVGEAVTKHWAAGTLPGCGKKH